MRPILCLGLAATALALGTVAAASQQAPASHTTFARREAMIPMRDGVRAQTHRTYHSPQHPSAVEVDVLEER
jgi:hypothetical protein